MTRRGRYGLVCLLFAATLNGCANSTANYSLGVGGTVALGHTPTTNIGQTYYLGMFDPREQLPPTIYRIRVQGQASALSTTAFASGWLRADLVDSLSGQIFLDKNQVRTTEEVANRIAPEGDRGALNRRLIMFGPEGFREAPRNHRLVVVMGSNPESFFSSVDRALGVVAGATQAAGGEPDVSRELWTDAARMREERRAMQTMLDLTGRE
ncbi:hypothetical protein [Duganella sp. CF458]|uniref:hypothetical protein n=1 Tax=Duganella sp. CF458 TaxID=1884368 RepID=UPI001113C778|nr:hypothetical protein [Duganella sp. CF458]